MSDHDISGRDARIVFKDESYAIQGAIFEVYREMGCGFLESVYQECLEKELSARGIPFEAQQELRLHYKRGSAPAGFQAGSNLLRQDHYRTEGHPGPCARAYGAGIE